MSAEKVLVQGESGTGKTFSIMKMNPKITAIVSPEKVRLPFRNQFPMLVGKTDSASIIGFMNEQVKAGVKSIIIDDFQYILAIPYMNRIHESGWDKYNDFGGNYFDIIDHCKKLPDDVIVYFMTHTETLEDGITRTKLIGKLLREKITVEGLYTIVFRTMVAEGKYYFVTQNSGKDTVKTPYGMFDTYAIENDLNYVDEKIRNYYYMDGAKSDEEMKQADKEASVPEVEKPTGKRRSRSERKQEEAKEALNKDLEKLDEIAGDREEIPFEETEKILPDSQENNHAEPEKTTRRSRRTRTAEPEQNNVLAEDSYFKTADGNFIMKHAGDTVPENATQITKEEFVAGGSATATADRPRRTRRVRKDQ